MKKYLKLIKKIPFITATAALTVCLIIFPEATASGVKNGIDALSNNLIPSLFPFMVLSSYISRCNFTKALVIAFSKPFNKLFKTGAYGILPFVLGLLGGYPIGAKTITELTDSGKLTENEAERLFYWCINPSPAFAVTAVGTFMLNSTQSGFILYISCIAASVTLGILCRFLDNGVRITARAQAEEDKTNAFVSSVSSGSEAMLSVCGWVLTFSALASLSNIIFTISPATNNFIKSIAEVTIGCRNAASQGLSLPVIASILGFGGFAVICQVSVYAVKCRVSTKNLIASRLIISALSGVYCSALTRFFPQCTNACAVFSAGNQTITLFNGAGTAAILLLMCVLLIFEVDNRKKLC